MESLDIPMIPKIRKFFAEHTQAKTFVLYGGRSSGKTHAIVQMICYRTLIESVSSIVFRASSVGLRDTILKDFKNIISECDFLSAHYEVGELVVRVRKESCYYKQGYGNISFQGLDKRHKNSNKGYGNFKYVFIDEASDISEEQLDAIHISFARHKAIMFLAFNPHLESDYVYEKYVKNYEITKEAERENIAVLSINYDENTFQNQAMKDLINTHKNVWSQAKFNHIYGGHLLENAGFLKEEYLKRFSYDAMLQMRFDKIIVSCDLANTTKEGSDFTAVCVFGIKDLQYYLLEPVCFKLEYTDAKVRIGQICVKWQAKCRTTVQLLIEDKAHGSPLIQEFSREPFMKQFTPTPSTKGNLSKERRLSNCIHIIEAGNVFIPTENDIMRYSNGDLKDTKEFIYQVTNFPHGKHDDFLDALTQTINYQHPHGIKYLPTKEFVSELLRPI